MIKNFKPLLFPKPEFKPYLPGVLKTNQKNKEMSFQATIETSVSQMVSNTYNRFFTMDKVWFCQLGSLCYFRINIFIQNYHFKLVILPAY